MDNFAEYAKSLERLSKKLDCGATFADDLRTIRKFTNYVCEWFSLLQKSLPKTSNAENASLPIY